MIHPTDSTNVLRLERLIRAPRERVWAAWTDPALMQQWSAPAGLHIPDGSIDLRVGGAWEVVMIDDVSGERHVAYGTYLEIRPPERLVQEHLWRLADGTSSPKTIVTVELRAEGDHTRLVLTQEGFTSMGSRDGHTEGWASAIGNLVTLLEDSR